MTRDLNHHNKRKIHFVLEQLKKKMIRSAEEIEVISILQSFIATRTIPESVKHRRNKDGDDQDGDKSGDAKYQRRKKDEKKKMDDAKRSTKEDDEKRSDKEEKKDDKDGKDGKKTASEMLFKEKLSNVLPQANNKWSTTMDKRQRFQSHSK